MLLYRKSNVQLFSCGLQENNKTIDSYVLVHHQKPYSKLLSQFEKVRVSKDSHILLDNMDEKVNPLKLIENRCNVTGTVIVDNIYIGKKPSIQIKLDGVVNRFYE